MRKAILSLFLVLAVVALTTQKACAATIGSWKNMLSYSTITQIESTDSKVYVLASGGLFSYNPTDGEVQTYDKTTGLSDCGIAHIRWCPAAKRLMVLYDNGNIDLLCADGSVINLPDYYNKTLTESKTVNLLTVQGKYVFMCTAFGVVKVNVANAEIADTYSLALSINDVAATSKNMFAATEQGLYSAPLTANLSDKNEWKKLSGRAYKNLFCLNDKLYGTNNGYLDAISTDGSYRKVYDTWSNKMLKFADHVLLFGTRHAYLFDTSETVTTIPNTFLVFGYNSSTRTFWVADNDADATYTGKLASVTFENNNLTEPVYGVRGITPDGPLTNNFFYMTLSQGKLMAVQGYGNPGDVMVYDGTTWSAFDNSFASTLGHVYRSHYCVATDPLNPSRTLVSGHTGLYEFIDGKFSRHWNMNNSALRQAVGVKEESYLNNTLVRGICFGSDGTAWITNPQSATTSVFSIAPDGTWTSHHQALFTYNFECSLHGLGQMFFDHNGLLWFTNNNWIQPALLCYDTATKALKRYTSFINQDFTPLSPLFYVRCAVEDADHNIWIGTDVGPAMLTASTLASGGDTFTQVKVPRNDGTNLADYLLSGLDINQIIVDGANRKWFATNTNGLYLIDSDNITQLHHFTTENSPLPSNEILSLALDNTTGELFIGTSAGLCSYMTDSSQPSDKMTKDNVYAYPNPVSPDYHGLITVVGLTLNADVKIVTANGALVAEGRSNGGTFTWDGCDKQGRRVASGVYMVQTATGDGGKGTVCKIAVVN